MDAPTRKDKIVILPADAASKLAYYGVGSEGVLAPRGWHCLETYGSDGDQLFVAPDPIDPANLFSEKWGGFTGPAIQVSYMSSDTSGRLAVAKVVARVFPAHMAFVKQVEAGGIEGNTDFPTGRYPADTLNAKGDVVEFTTPATQDGLGTASRLAKNDDPITGVAILRLPKESLVQLSMRLPADAQQLAPVITHEIERENK